jgi:hypothetical protein
MLSVSASNLIFTRKTDVVDDVNTQNCHFSCKTNGVL